MYVVVGYIIVLKSFMQQPGSGKCDIDKKPSYCSVKCQRKDWKTHKVWSPSSHLYHQYHQLSSSYLALL